MDYFSDPELNGKYLGTITRRFAGASAPREPGTTQPQTKSRVGALLLPLAARLA